MSIRHKLSRFKVQLAKTAVFLLLVEGVVIVLHNLGPLAQHDAAGRFSETITERADSDRYILLAMVDEAFADMALNLYEASLLPHGIDNFLFVGVGTRTCEILAPLPCYHFADDQNSSVASSYGHEDFIRKMNIRTDMILEALAANFTVVHTDLDIAFLTNPFGDIKKVMLKADIAALWDSTAYNAGFVVIKPTKLTKQIYETVRKITNNSTIDDQQALNKAIKSVSKKTRGLMKIVALNKKRYLCGVSYFEKSSRWFPLNDSCARKYTDQCPAVVHNNWIVSKAAKVYRFREHLMWMFDPNGAYYGSRTQRYLTYDNPLPVINRKKLSLSKSEQANISKDELSALQTALAMGQILDRVVILPRFHCGPRAYECPLNSLVSIRAFDAEFSGRYRENSFLKHPKVPTDVRHAGTRSSNVAVFKNCSVSTESGHTDLMDLLESVQISNRDDPVLAFRSMYGCLESLRNVIASVDVNFGDKIARGFRRAVYRQYEV